MQMPPMAMTITDWDEVPLSRHAGERGYALWRTRQFGEIRVRMVEYSPGYLADHWRPKGHVILCLNGSIDIEIADGAQLRLTPGQSYYVGDGEPGHRSSAVEGAKLFIVD